MGVSFTSMYTILSGFFIPLWSDYSVSMPSLSVLFNASVCLVLDNVTTPDQYHILFQLFIYILRLWFVNIKCKYQNVHKIFKCIICINILWHFMYPAQGSFCIWQLWIWTLAAAERTRCHYSGFLHENRTQSKSRKTKRARTEFINQFFVYARAVQFIPHKRYFFIV